MANEKRLISLDEALKATYSEIYWTESQQAAVRSFLVTQPKVDAVEVVRCKDCKYWEKGKDYEAYCNHWAGMLTDTVEDDFCSYGERKDKDA